MISDKRKGTDLFPFFFICKSSNINIQYKSSKNY